MRKIEYSIYKDKNNEISITALVGPYGFSAEGKLEDWTIYIQEQMKKNNWDQVKLYAESQDKQTGYSSENFICVVKRKI